MKIAVVGHDTTLPGAGLGTMIDNYDAVVRMVNCGWQNPEDYGVRYDYGMASFSGFSLAEIRMPEKALWVYDKHGKFHPEPPKHGVDVTDYLRIGICHMLPHFAKHTVQAGMSRGCAAVLSTMYVLHPASVTLFGMGQLASGVRQETRHPDVYRAVLTDEQKAKPDVQNDHCWDAENKLIAYMSEVMKCELLTNTGA